MENKNVTIYLNTPLLQPDKELRDKNSHLMRGKLIEETPNGFWVQATKKIFIPTHKIDFIEVE